MVFEKLMIVRGIILNTKQLFILAKKIGCDKKECDEIYSMWKNDEDDLRYELYEDINNKLKKYYINLEIFNFPCCTEAKDTYILGIKIKIYKRVVKQCSECPKYACCDNCIGFTSNGYYDVNKILNEPVIAKKEDIEDIENIKINFEVNFLEIIFDKKFDNNYYYMLDDCLSCT